MKCSTFFGMAILAILAESTLAQEVEVGWVGVTRVDDHYEGQGGEFTIIFENTSLSTAGYVAGKTSDITSAPSFQTFCVETSETIVVPSSGLKAYVSEYAVRGGGGGEDPDFDLDFLEAPTAWLYTQFATGNLTGYSYGTSDSAGTLQRLIWGLEGEGGTDSNFENDWGDLVDDYFGVTLASGDKDLIRDWQTEYGNSGWSGIGNVRVLNLYTVNSPETPAQSQLVYCVPLPATVLLGLIGLGAAGRKLRRFI